MSSKHWEKSRRRDISYSRRRPESTNLYRIVNSSHERLEWEWGSRYEQEYGYFRKVVERSFREYLKCGILEHGCARLSCGAKGCPGGGVVAFSCKKRLVCPSCAAKRAIIFAEHLHENLLGEVPIRHMVFSLPKRLRPFFKYSRKNNTLLFRASWETILALYREILPEGVPGVVQVLQTAGGSLNFNPHLHDLVTAGVFAEDGSFYSLDYVNENKATEYFAHRVLRHMQKASLITEEVTRQILSQKHSGFSVWAGPAIPAEDSDTRHFLARYIDRGPIVLDKISIEHDIITYKTDDALTHEFDGTEFLARLSQHIPNRYESIVRYYGAWSYRYRGEQKKKAPQDIEIQPVPEGFSKKKASRAWAALIKKVHLVDPLVCPKCGEQMKIVEFPKNPKDILALCESLKNPKFKAPPLLRAPPDR